MTDRNAITASLGVAGSLNIVASMCLVLGTGIVGAGLCFTIYLMGDVPQERRLQFFGLVALLAAVYLLPALICWAILKALAAIIALLAQQTRQQATASMPSPVDTAAAALAGPSEDELSAIAGLSQMMQPRATPPRATLARK